MTSWLRLTPLAAACVLSLAQAQDRQPCVMKAGTLLGGLLGPLPAGFKPACEQNFMPLMDKKEVGTEKYWVSGLGAHNVVIRHLKAAGFASTYPQQNWTRNGNKQLDDTYRKGQLQVSVTTQSPYRWQSNINGKVTNTTGTLLTVQEMDFSRK